MSSDGYQCTNCTYHPLYLHLPAELRCAAQLEWKQNGGTYIPLRFRLEYCRIPGSDCDTINGNLRTDGTVEIVTPPGSLPYTSCPTPGTPIVKLWSVDNYDWSLGFIGLNQHSDADAKFTQHNLGQCGVGDYTMTLNTPWTWLYETTTFCYRYQFQ